MASAEPQRSSKLAKTGAFLGTISIIGGLSLIFNVGPQIQYPFPEPAPLVVGVIMVPMSAWYLLNG